MEEIIKKPGIKISRKALLFRLGYPDKALDNAKYLKSFNRIDELLKENINLINTSGIYRIYSYSIIKDSLYLEEPGLEIKSGFLAGKFTPSGKIGFFVVTIGKALEEKATELSLKNTLTDGLILDSIGSIAAESAANTLHNHIQKRLNKRLIRFSPGYIDERIKTDWDINDQKKIFEMLKPERIGMSLTEGCMMIPRKSVSAIIGEKKNQ